VAATTKFEYSATPQSVHAIDPPCDLCLPATQAVQLSLFPVQPGLQVHSVVPSIEKEFAGHGLQAVMSRLRTGENEFIGQYTHKTKFAGQSRHETESSYWPARHPQLVIDSDVDHVEWNPLKPLLKDSDV